MIAIDTNVLVFAHRAEAPQHAAALQALQMLGASNQPWSIPWPCLHEFLAVVTGPAFRNQATPLATALEAVAAWTSHHNCTVLAEEAGYLPILAGLAQRAKLKGGAIHDARIAAICIQHEVSELWTADRDFQMFPDLRTRNPLIPGLHQPMARYGEPASVPVRRAQRKIVAKRPRLVDRAGK